MLQLLINLLTPIFEGMDVSPTDVVTYVNNLSGYIYAIVGTLVLAIVIIIVSQVVVKKGKRHLVGWGTGLSWVPTVISTAGTNTHRTAFNGRNFEYFSEDPYLAGKMAAGSAVEIPWLDKCKAVIHVICVARPGPGRC